MEDKAKDSDTWVNYLDGESIQAIGVDKDCLWLGTDSGLIRFSRQANEVLLTRYSEAAGLLGSDVQAIKVYKNEVWIGTWDGGLSKFDGTKFTHYSKEQGLFDSRVMALDVDEESVWLGVCFGLSRFEKKTAAFHNYELPGGFAPMAGVGSVKGAEEDNPRRVYADSILIDGEYIWHAGWNAIMSNHDLTESKQFACGDIIASRVTSICKAGNHVYLGVTGGLVGIDTTTLEITHFKQGEGEGHKDGLLGTSVLAVTTDGRFLWIGTDGGITRFDVESSELARLSQGYQEGLIILSMSVDENYVWIGTMNGLFRLSKSAEPYYYTSVEPYFYSPLLDDFEDPVLSKRVWGVPSEYVTPSGITQLSFIDSTIGANGSKSSLCLTYELEPEPAVAKDNYHAWCEGGSICSKDITPYEGFTFFYKAEGPAPDNLSHLAVLLSENTRENSERPRENFGIPLELTLGEWQHVVIPFTAFPIPGLSSDETNGILELAQVDLLWFEYMFQYWRPGKELKLWIDDIGFYKKGEFESTVPEGDVTVDRGTEEEQVLRIEGLPIKEELSPREASHYVQLDRNRVQCQRCPNQCLLEDGERGICRVRQNIEGKLYSLVYGQPCALALDPIEKGPIFHMTPGATSLVVATAGCNFNCKYCQNWQFALVNPEETRNYDLPPEEAVQLALDNGCEAIVFTYTEAIVSYEYMLDIAKLAKQRGLKTVLITNGYINPQPLRELCQYLDAIKVDLKGFTEEFYREVCSGQLEPVLGTLKVVKEEGVWLEIVNLVVPMLNDDLDKIEEMCKWIKDNLGTGVPLHFSRFWPCYKLSKISGTSVDTLEQAIQIAKDAGLKYVYIGNVPGHEAGDTYCPQCGECLIKRVGYAAVTENNVVDGRCKFCEHEIPGVWE